MTFYLNKFVENNNVSLFRIDADRAIFTTDKFFDVIVDIVWDIDLHEVKLLFNAGSCPFESYTFSNGSSHATEH